MSLAPSYTDEYRRKAFDTWVLAGRCPITRLIEILPANEQGNRPNAQTVRSWMDDENWHQRADLIHTTALELADADLVQTKSEMLKQQYRDAVEIATHAKKALIDKGFDTSAAAVSAYFKSVEEQRRVAGLAAFLEKVGTMTDEQIEQEIAERMARMKDAVVGEIIDREPESTEGSEAESGGS